MLLRDTKRKKRRTAGRQTEGSRRSQGPRRCLAWGGASVLRPDSRLFCSLGCFRRWAPTWALFAGLLDQLCGRGNRSSVSGPEDFFLKTSARLKNLKLFCKIPLGTIRHQKPPLPPSNGPAPTYFLEPRFLPHVRRLSSLTKALTPSSAAFVRSRRLGARPAFLTVSAR